MNEASLVAYSRILTFDEPQYRHRFEHTLLVTPTGVEALTGRLPTSNPFFWEAEDYSLPEPGVKAAPAVKNVASESSKRSQKGFSTASRPSAKKGSAGKKKKKRK